MFYNSSNWTNLIIFGELNYAVSQYALVSMRCLISLNVPILLSSNGHFCFGKKQYYDGFKTEIKIC